MLTLPTEPLPAISDLKGCNILIESDYGIGKTGLLASTGYLCADPEDKMKAYPNTLRVPLTKWEEHKEFIQAVAGKPAGTFAGIGLDTLNVSYDQCLVYIMRTVRFAGNFYSHPSENPQLCYPRITHEFTTWVRDVTLLGYHVIATCHVSLIEVSDKKGSKYNRWIPAFVGGAPGSTYAQVLKIFPLIGFMTLEEVERAPTRVVMGKVVADVRADGSRLDVIETEQRRVIRWEPSPNWLANNKFGGFPDQVILTDRWQEDWKILQTAWGTGDKHELVDEEVKTTNLQAPAQAKAVGLGK